MTTTTTYAAAGLTCAHCVTAVTGELRKLPSVLGVTVDLVAGGTSSVHVISAAPLDDAEVRDALDEAGYVLVGATR